MYYIIKGHNFVDETVSVLMIFYPNDKYIQTESVAEDTTLVSVFDGKSAKAQLYTEGELKAEAIETAENTDRGEIKRVIGLSIARAVNSIKNISLPWGILTGVRPAKLINQGLDQGRSIDEISQALHDKYLVSREKLELMTEVAAEERSIVEAGKGKIGLYIGIPFCPTRCLYCSFTSYPLKKYSSKVDSYIDCLIKEMKFTKQFTDKREIESIYIGGGTPTSLSEAQLDRLLSAVEENFAIPEEYTVEAGRPDTLNREKLRILKAHNATRISINPQTLNRKTLELIGREHTAAMFINAFEMAREEGHDHINTDIILGLPGEGEKEVINTMEGLERLSPESITVHTLAVKRASRLRETLEKYSMPDAEAMEKHIAIARHYTEKMGMRPYYMYRQKNMVGNFENVGYCKKNCQCIYNVQIMEEKQSIIALGAGASTKTVDPATDRIERIFNVKSVEDYITRIDEMLERKRALETLL